MLSRAWCFTLNNPAFSPGDLPLHGKERYVVWQLEKGEQGTTHIQGYMEMTTPTRLASMKEWLPSAHFEPRRGTPQQARDYCMKVESRQEGPWERGVFGGRQGKRSDLDGAVATLKEGGLAAVAEAHPTTFVQFHKGLAALEKTMRIAPSDKDFVPRSWQQSIIDTVKGTPDDRKIIWIWDTAGNMGKSRLSRHLVAEHGAIVLSGRVADMAYAYNDHPIAIFDISRTQAETADHLYSFAEQLKNGILFSSKYDSGQKVFTPPHVIFFSNMDWPQGKFSEDRRSVVNLDSRRDFDALFRI